MLKKILDWVSFLENTKYLPIIGKHLHKLYLKKNCRLGVKAHTNNPSIWRLRKEDGKFEASLGHKAKPHPKKGGGKEGWGDSTVVTSSNP